MGSLIYASNDANEKDMVWQDLEFLTTQITIPWLIVRDYNCVL